MKGRFTLLWLDLAVLLPVTVLAALAAWGIHSRFKSAWEEARNEAAQLAAIRSEQLASSLKEQIDTAITYPAPPTPGQRTELDDILDGENEEALLALRDNPAAGISPGGLPRRALAAMRLHHINPQAQDLDDILRILVTEEPSVITSMAMNRLDANSAYTAEHSRAEEARWLARKIAVSGDTQAWITFARGQSEPNPWWIKREGREVRFLLPEKVLAEVRTAKQNLPKWAVMRISAPGLQLTEKPKFPEVAETAVPFSQGLRMSIFADPRVLEGDIKAQQRWTQMLLVAATLIAITSLFLIHRAVLRERRLAEMKTQFVSSVSHELRAPLGSIRLMAEALEQGKATNPANFHKLIASEGTRLSHLIENVLDFARIEEGRKRYHFEESNLTALLQHGIDLLSPTAQEKQVKLDVSLEPVTASVDAEAIEQAVINLLDNAIKFSPKGGNVRILSTELGDHWQLVISDEGPGIPKNEREHIFERFYRLGDELRRETQGTGIGLSIVKHVVEAHGGSVQVSSNRPTGATFTLNIPIEPCAS